MFEKAISISDPLTFAAGSLRRGAEWNPVLKMRQIRKRKHIVLKTGSADKCGKGKDPNLLKGKSFHPKDFGWSPILRQGFKWPLSYHTSLELLFLHLH